MSSKADYDKLRAVWYKKLEKDGFKDIEDDQERLKSWSARFTLNGVPQLYKEKEPYYYLATRFLNEFKFDTKREQIIWEYHSEGLSPREIAKLLSKVNRIRTNRTTIWQIIKRLEKSMKSMYLSNYQGRNE